MDVPVEEDVHVNCGVGVSGLIGQHQNQSNTELTSSYHGMPTTTANSNTKRETPISTIIARTSSEHFQHQIIDSTNPENLPSSDFTCVLEDVTSPTSDHLKHLQDQSPHPCPHLTSDAQNDPTDIAQNHSKPPKGHGPQPEHLPCPVLTSDLEDVPTITSHSHSKDIQDPTIMEGPALPLCFNCSLCQTDFITYQRLKEHLQLEHFGDNTLLQHLDNQIKHVLMFSGRVSFQCDICNLHFAEFDLAEKHLECHRIQEETCGEISEDVEHQKVCSNVFTCGVCGKGYTQKSELNRHRKSHDLKKCTFCPKTFFVDSDLETHMHYHRVLDIGESGEALSHKSVSNGEEPNLQNYPKGLIQGESSHSAHYTLTKDSPSDGIESTEQDGDVANQPQEGPEEMEEEEDDDFSDLISFDNQTVFVGDAEHVKNSNPIENEDSQIHSSGTESLAQVEIFQCELCDETFMSLQGLKTHEVCHEDEPLKCKTREDCSEVFEASGQLNEHQLTHSTTEVHKCAICDKHFLTKNTLERHKSMHTGDKAYKCQFCEKCFRLPSSLQHHERIHKGLMPFKCDICLKRFRLSQALKKHIFEYHSKDKPYKCDICEKGFVEKGRLAVHRSRIHFGRPKEKVADEYICVLCQKGFNSKDSLDEHLKNFHSKKKDGELTSGEKVSDELDKVFICMKCGKGFNTCEKLLAHMRRHGEPSWMDKSGSCRSTCPICHKSVNYLQKHLITHTGLKPFQCEVCDKAFPERYILTKHMKSHSTIRQFECKLCTSSFKRGDNLKRHLRITHSVDPEKYDTKQISVTRDKEFLCKKCDVVFMDEDEFKQHKKGHSEKIPAVCSMCGKIFTNNIHLKSHMKIHANWRPYMCETCGKTFTENSQLKKHTRIHTGEKPYACQLCDKSFSQSCSLNSHMKSHQFAGQTPFKCNLCPAEFAYCGELERHKKGHMGTDVFGCGICSLRFSHSDHLKAHVDEHLGKSNQIIESDLEVGPVIETAIPHMNPFQSDPCMSYPVSYSNPVDPVATVSYSNPADPVATMSYPNPLDPVVSYAQVDAESVTNGVTVTPYPSDPNLNQSITSDALPQGINMFQMQTLVQEAELLIQCTQHNQ